MAASLPGRRPERLVYHRRRQDCGGRGVDLRPSRKTGETGRTGQARVGPPHDGVGRTRRERSRRRIRGLLPTLGQRRRAPDPSLVRAAMRAARRTRYCRTSGIGTLLWTTLGVCTLLFLSGRSAGAAIFGLVDTGEIYSSGNGGATWNVLATLPVNDAVGIAAGASTSELFIV